MKLLGHCIAFTCLLATPLVLPANTQDQALTGQVTVVNKHLVRDGQPWVPHGFFQVAFAVPPGAFNTVLPDGTPINPVYQIAYSNYSRQEYADMRQAGADSVRLNISQSASDPENTKYFDQQFLNTVIGAIHAARAAGLSVIIAAQDESQGEDTKAVFSSFLTPTSQEACSAANGYTPGTGDGPSTSFGPGKVIESWYLTGVVPQKPE